MKTRKLELKWLLISEHYEIYLGLELRGGWKDWKGKEERGGLFWDKKQSVSLICKHWLRENVTESPVCLSSILMPPLKDDSLSIWLNPTIEPDFFPFPGNVPFALFYWLIRAFMQEERSECMEPTFRFLRKMVASNNQLKYLVLVTPYKISTYEKESTK